MTDQLPDAFVDSRLGGDYEILRDTPVPLSTADAMALARSAYLQGYLDRLHGVAPERESE